MTKLSLILAVLALTPPPAAALSFEEARLEALGANPEAKAARLSLEAADLRLRAARGSFYPSVSAAASYARSGTQGYQPGDSYSYGFTGTQPIFSPAVPSGVRAAAGARSAAAASYDRTASRLAYELKVAFADILNARDTLKLSDETLKRREENLELIRLKYKAGRENKAALLETEAALKTARWQHGRYGKNLRLLERKLNLLLGRRPPSPVPGLELPAEEELPSDFASLEPRLKRHYSVRAAAAARDSARAAADSAASARLPEASANASYRWNGSDWPATASSWSMGASLSLPLFSGGRLKSSEAAARRGFLSAEEALRSAEDDVFLAAEDAFLSWQEARDYLGVAESSLAAAEARAWLVRTQYLAGQSSYFEWRNVEEQLISEQNQYLSARRGLAVSRAALSQAIGE